MSQLSVTEAAMSGYRLAVKRPLLMLAWAGISFLASIVLAIVALLIMVPLVGGIAGLGELQSLDSADGQLSPAVWSVILPVYGVVLVVALLWSAIQQTAVNRLVLRPEDKGFAYFKIGGDEFRQIAVMVVYFLLFIGWCAVWAGISFGVGLVADGAVGGLLGFVTQLALAGLFIFLAVRLSLASALTFDQRRINIFGSWGATKGRFWPMLGAYLLAWLLALAVVVGLYMLLGLIMLAAVGGGFASMGSGSDPEALARLMTPTVIILYLLILPISQIAGVVLSLGILAPPPDIQRQLSPALSTFD